MSREKELLQRALDVLKDIGEEDLMMEIDAYLSQPVTSVDSEPVSENEIKDLLVNGGCLRQHRHNFGSEEFIPAWDYEETIKVLSRAKLYVTPQETPVVEPEPVAYINGYYGGYITIRLINESLIVPDGMALYASPPAQSARVANLEKELKRICDIHTEAMSKYHDIKQQLSDLERVRQSLFDNGRSGDAALIQRAIEAIGQ